MVPTRATTSAYNTSTIIIQLPQTEGFPYADIYCQSDHYPVEVHICHSCLYHACPVYQASECNSMSSTSRSTWPDTDDPMYPMLSHTCCLVLSMRVVMFMHRIGVSLLCCRRRYRLCTGLYNYRIAVLLRRGNY